MKNRIAFTLAVLPAPLMAHPGHDAAASGGAHWLAQADHLAVLGLVVAFAALVGTFARRRQRRAAS